MAVKRAVVIGVGDELLSGLVVNSNAAMIGELLLAAGLPVSWSMCVADVEDEIVSVLQRACVDADIVVVTGGLGPTQDDRTREALARLLSDELVRDQGVVDAIAERFRAFGRTMPASNAKQADRPARSVFIENPWGTAPGIRAEHEGAVIYAMPGVPGEARHMLTEQILPELTAAGVAHLIRSRIFHCVGLSESDLADRFDDLAGAENPKMAFLPGGGEIRLRFVATGESLEVCDVALQEAERVVRERVGEFVYGTDGATLEQIVGELLMSRSLTVATAESCTAGMLAARIADVPGSSEYLVGGIVAYATDVKEHELGVPSEMLAASGPVSEEVAERMALGAKERFATDIALAITCAAGPGPQDGVEPGTTVLALAGLDGVVEVRSLRLPGDRPQVRRFATTFALNMLRLHLLQR